MPLHIIATVGADGTVGCKGELPWHSPPASQARRRYTDQSPLIIGRRAFEETTVFGHRPGLTPTTLVLSEDEQYSTPAGIEHCQMIRRCVARLAPSLAPAEPIYLTGGRTTLTRGLDWANTVTFIRLAETYAGDTAPSLSETTWTQEGVTAQESYTIERYAREDASLPSPQRQHTD